MPPLLYLTLGFPKTETALDSHLVGSAYRQKITLRDVWGQNNGADEPLQGWSLGGTLLGCIFSAVILAIAIYCGWKFGAPRPSYYEKAMRIHKRKTKYQRRQTRRHPQRSLGKVTPPMCWADPGGNVADDQLSRPDAAMTRSSSVYDDNELEGNLYIEAHKRVASKW